MSGPKPTLGYPSRTAAIEALRAKGLGTHQIAYRIGISPKDVAALEASKQRTRKQRGHYCARPRPDNASIAIDPELRMALRPHAIARDLSVTALARRIIETVAHEDMVDAVLDDGEGVAGRDGR